MVDRSEAEIVGFITQRAEEAGASNGYQYAEAFRKVSFRT
jgi:hypothetical protein